MLITDHWATDTQVWLVFTCNYSNDVNPEAWYSTNLMATDTWSQATGSVYTYSGPSGVYTQWFGLATNSPMFYYRVTGTTN